MPMVTQLIQISPRILWNLHSSWQCRSVLSQTINTQNPSLYSFLKSTSILYSHIHTGLINVLFPSHFPIKNLFNITFTPIHATFLTHFATVLWYPSTWQTVQIMKLHILHPSPPISSVFCWKTILITVLEQNQFITEKKHSPVLKTLFMLFIPCKILQFIFQPTKWTNYKAIKQITTTFHITYQLLHISEPRCHLHRVYKKTKGLMSNTHFTCLVALPSSLRIKSLKMLKF